MTPKYLVTIGLALGALVLSLATAPASAATSTTWVLERGRDIPSPQPRRLTLRMHGQSLSGSTGCNTYTATLERAKGRVAVKGVALTRMLCEAKLNTVETAFVGALGQTAFVVRNGRTLTFQSGDRAALLVWRLTQKASRKLTQRRAHNAHQPRRSHGRRLAPRPRCPLHAFLTTHGRR